MTVDEPSEFGLRLPPTTKPGRMTEPAWRQSSDCLTLIRAARGLFPGRSPDCWARKVRLAACGCYRAVWDLLPDEVLKAAVEAAENYADGLRDLDDMQDARTEILRQSHWLKSPYVEGCLQLLHRDAGRAADSCVAAYDWRAPDESCTASERYTLTRQRQQGAARRHADIARDVFGNPFRPVTFDPAWRTSTAVTLAKQMYEGRDFGAMPILADALQDAGCENAEVLEHCRGSGPHVRGCWVVDLVLGKS